MQRWDKRGPSRVTGGIQGKQDPLDGLPPTVLLEGLRHLGRRKLETLMSRLGMVGTMRQISAAKKAAAAARGDAELAEDLPGPGAPGRSAGPAKVPLDNGLLVPPFDDMVPPAGPSDLLNDPVSSSTTERDPPAEDDLLTPNFDDPTAQPAGTATARSPEAATGVRLMSHNEINEMLENRQQPADLDGAGQKTAANPLAAAEGSALETRNTLGEGHRRAPSGAGPFSSAPSAPDAPMAPGGDTLSHEAAAGDAVAKDRLLVPSFDDLTPESFKAIPSSADAPAARVRPHRRPIDPDHYHEVHRDDWVQECRRQVGSFFDGSGGAGIDANKVRAFQARHSLRVDGLIGPQTIDAAAQRVIESATEWPPGPGVGGNRSARMAPLHTPAHDAPRTGEKNTAVRQKGGSAGPDAATLHEQGSNKNHSSIPPQAVPDGTTSSADDRPPLRDDELVVTRDPAQATMRSLARYRRKIAARVTSWGLEFDPSTVRLASVASSADAPHAIALSWLPAWGTRPATSELSSSMRPIDAKAAQAGAHRLAGWTDLKPEDRTIVDHLLGGETNDLSNATRNFLRTKFPGLASKSADQQGSTLKGVIGNKHAAPPVVSEEVDVTPIDVELSGPTEKRHFAFHGKKADGESWTATYTDGTSFEIIAPKAPTPGYHNHTARQVADAARYLPKFSRALVKQIILNAISNPEDPHWAAQYHISDFHSYMTAGEAGVVRIYPTRTGAALPSKDYMRGTMIHETGHTFSLKSWGTDDSKGKWLKWREAMEADKVSVSSYAMNSIDEDVAETIQAYGSTKGTRKFDEYKALVPNRFAILAKEFI